MHVLVLDWGIGGIDTWVRLRQQNPAWSTTYVSDAGFTSYGKGTKPDLVARFGAIVVAAGADLDVVVIACNAMSTILDRPSDDDSPVLRAAGVPLAVPTFGVIEAGIAAARARGPRRIGIIGGQRTIDSKIHESRLTSMGFAVRAVVAQPLSAHVEAGRLSGPEVTADVAHVVSQLTAGGWVPEALVLACTHYPALAPLFATALPQTELLDPAETLVATVSRWGAKRAISRPLRHRVFTTGDPLEMRQGAYAAFGVELPAEIQGLPGL